VVVALAGKLTDPLCTVGVAVACGVAVPPEVADEDVAHPVSDTASSTTTKRLRER
jgi:hypothetical protein